MEPMEPHSLRNNSHHIVPQPKPPPTGSARPAAHIGWGWVLLIAPGRLLTVHSPLSTAEVERRLRQQTSSTVLSASRRLTIRLPTARTQRRFFGGIEPNPANPASSLVIGQTRTPARTAFIRAGLSLILFWLALFWLSTAHTWLGVLFAIGCVSFLLLGQYERLTERDRRLYVAWLRQVIDAEPVDPLKRE